MRGFFSDRQPRGFTRLENPLRLPDNRLSREKLRVMPDSCRVCVLSQCASHRGKSSFRAKNNSANCFFDSIDPNCDIARHSEGTVLRVKRSLVIDLHLTQSHKPPLLEESTALQTYP